MQGSEENAQSASVEDYLKAIYSLTTRERTSASTSDLAQLLGLSAGSVSTMLGRMDGSGLVEHTPYRGVELTEKGQRLALGVIRRHRLLESFLATSLDIPWDDVHRFADALEHSVSEELIDIIARKLGDPVADPHGDPIPTRDLEIVSPETRSLADLTPGEEGELMRVSDSDPAMLRYLAECGISIGDRVEMVARQPFEGPCDVRIGGRDHSLGLALARAIRIG
ncbi:MAG: metal-dependent transcriptional regulator [Solirubrobacterales bacterium]|nr:metal-dependent transcriptional regulator [Solirubrobacterales bacterium]